MPIKRISGTFFSFSQTQPKTIDRLLSSIKSSLGKTSDKLVNIELSNEFFRIVELNKENFLNVGREVWIGIIEKLDTSELTVTSDIKGNRQEHGNGEEEGPVTHTGFIYDPLTSVFFLHKRIGGINYSRLERFVKALLKETGLVKDPKGYNLTILPDPDKFERLKKAPSIRELTFAYKAPENFENLVKGNKSIPKEFLMIEDFNSDFMRIQIKGESLDKQVVIKTVEQLQKLFGKGVSTAKAVAEHDDIEEVLDLLNDKLTDFHDINLIKGMKITETVIIDSIKAIFNNNVGVLDQRFISRQNK